ncbi:chemotaxis protein CheB [Pendulispora albinea]|uniref:protein-glutamate methylesterase n=1 Tax=Pendulispora albinea TaxID=2741071 RepID=A0ABZ2LQ64_9BACT
MGDARHELIVVGTSWGGLHALSVLLSSLPRDFEIPLAIVQHRRHDSDDTLAQLLQAHTAMRVREAEDKEPIREGRVYIAPADYHLLVDGRALALSTDPPVRFSRPSIDVLFESAADSFQHRLIGIVLTGSNHDGARGLSRIKQRGGLTIVQNPASAESPTMPEGALALDCVDRILELDQIGSFLAQLRQR